MVVRAAKDQDHDKLDRMFKRYARYDQDRYLYRVLERTEPSSIRVATYWGQMVGCAYGHDHGQGIGVVAGLFIAKPFASSLLAQALLRESFQHLQDAGCTDIISMISEQESLRESYTALGFREWQRKAWCFIELPDNLDSQPDQTPVIDGVNHEEKVLRLLGDQDLIPSRFWYHRVTWDLMHNACISGRVAIAETNGEFSAIIWEDIYALKVMWSNRASYFLFDEACRAQTEVGTPVRIREVSLAEGPRAESLVNHTMRDAHAQGIQTIILHKGATDGSLASQAGLRFSAPRIVLRSSVGISLDTFLVSPTLATAVPGGSSQ